MYQLLQNGPFKVPTSHHKRRFLIIIYVVYPQASICICVLTSAFNGPIEVSGCNYLLFLTWSLVNDINNSYFFTLSMLDINRFCTYLYWLIFDPLPVQMTFLQLTHWLRIKYFYRHLIDLSNSFIVSSQSVTNNRNLIGWYRVQIYTRNYEIAVLYTKTLKTSVL